MGVRKRKTDEADLRNKYRIYIELGLILSLVLLIVAFSVDLRTETAELPPSQEQEVVQMEEIQQTEQVEQPPPPPKPPVPVEVPNDEVLEDEDLNLDASLDLDDPVSNEAPPPPPEETEEEAEPETFVIVEEMPEMLPNRQEGMRQLQGCVKYPEMAKRAGVEGRVFVQFVVNEQGQVTNPQVTRGIGAGTEEEALRCVQQLEFKPGQQRGKAVRVKMSLPVTFKLR